MKDNDIFTRAPQAKAAGRGGGRPREPDFGGTPGRQSGALLAIRTRQNTGGLLVHHVSVPSAKLACTCRELNKLAHSWRKVLEHERIRRNGRCFLTIHELWAARLPLPQTGS